MFLGHRASPYGLRSERGRLCYKSPDVTNEKMNDVPAAVRSRIMRAIRSKNTKPELQVRRALHAAGYRFRLHQKELPGTPDIVLPRHRIAVQVNGCFWHGHDCPRGQRRPSTNVGYWVPKFAKNQQRNSAAAKALSESGWTVVIIWECQLESGTAHLLQMLAGLSIRVDTT